MKKNNSIYVIGITGGIGTGKSTVAGLCREAGLPVLDADKISHSVTQANGLAIQEIKDSFGADYISEDQSLNRKKMSDLVFHDKKALDQLSLIVHHYTLKQMSIYLDQLKASGEKVAVLDVPIPVKEGFLDLCNIVWNVTANEEIRLVRLQNRGMSIEDAKRRIMIQMTPAQYSELADIDIDNSYDFDILRKQVNQLLEDSLGARGLPYKKI